MDDEIEWTDKSILIYCLAMLGFIAFLFVGMLAPVVMGIMLFTAIVSALLYFAVRSAWRLWVKR